MAVRTIDPRTQRAVERDPVLTHAYDILNPARQQMSIFGKMMSKIFGRDEKAAAPAATAAPASAPAAKPAATASAAPMSTVDVEKVLEGLASKYNHPVNWRTSIVDLMAILGIDNSLAERRELAKELGYTGDTKDTATMNIWLHKQVMRKLAENGGKVPADLLD